MEQESGQIEPEATPSRPASHRDVALPGHDSNPHIQDRTGALTPANHLLHREVQRHKRLEREILALEQKLQHRHAPEAGEIARLVSQALTETRQLSRGLYPINLDETGLTSALSTLAHVTQNACGVHCTFEGQAHEEAIYAERALCVGGSPPAVSMRRAVLGDGGDDRVESGS